MNSCHIVKIFNNARKALYKKYFTNPIYCSLYIVEKYSVYIATIFNYYVLNGVKYVNDNFYYITFCCNSFHEMRSVVFRKCRNNRIEYQPEVK